MINHRIYELQSRLDEINSGWTKDRFEALLNFFVRITPQLLDSERCGIFIVEPQTHQVWSKAGTKIEEREIQVPIEHSVVGRCITNRKAEIINDLGSDPDHHWQTDQQTGFHSRNSLCYPVSTATDSGVVGAIQVLNRNNDEPFIDEHLQLLGEIANFLSMALGNIYVNQEILRVSHQLQDQVQRLQINTGAVPGLITKNPNMQRVIDLAVTVSTTPVNVLITGENGTGKELLAQLIHNWGERQQNPFVPVNCAAIPTELVESEFFGYEKGAFTGATRTKPGKFEEATGGSLFLDEVADMPLQIQPKFLRVLQEQEGYRLGSNEKRDYDFRLISATNRDLRAAMADGMFREDLYYRLFSVLIHIPPLRDREEDILPLCESFLKETSHKFQKPTPKIDGKVLDALQNYHWPGNIRQLQREIERLVALSPPSGQITLDLCSSEIRSQAAGLEKPLPGPHNLATREKTAIQNTLRETRYNKTKAAESLGISRPGLYKKMRRYGIAAHPENAKPNG